MTYILGVFSISRRVFTQVTPTTLLLQSLPNEWQAWVVLRDELTPYSTDLRIAAGQLRTHL